MSEAEVEIGKRLKRLMAELAELKQLAWNARGGGIATSKWSRWHNIMQAEIAIGAADYEHRNPLPR